jgi:hypothetical protein
MNTHRSTSLAVLVSAAWLAAACQSSPLRPSPPVPQQTLPPAPAAAVYSITGIVTEAAIGPDSQAAPLSGATFSIGVDPEFPLSTSTDENGWFTLSQPAGAVIVTVSKDGYETQVLSVEVVEDMVLNVELKRAELAGLRRRR